jgi:aldehyde dehydrogenase (NAD+)
MADHLIINGERVSASDKGTFDVFDPSSGELLATVAKATKSDVDRAVSAAHAAMDSKAWGGIVPAERGRIMNRIAAALRERAEELATLESRDNGKPLRQARTDVQVAARYFEFFAGIADKIMGNTIPLGPGYLDFTVREPIGVSAQIVPWNYPIQIGARGVAPALAAGCAVVLKPSSEAPMTALRLGEIGLECGLPPGALNVIPGTGSEAGTALASHPDINQLTFTGSVDVGVAVAKMAADKRRARRHGAGRQVAEHCFCGRGSRSGRAGRQQCDFSERRPDVLGRVAACSLNGRPTTSWSRS